MKIQAKIDRMINAGNIKAIASVSLDGMFVVKNLKVMDGRKGLFVSMPQESYSDREGNRKYGNTFFAITNSAKTDLQEAVLDAYKLRLDPKYTPKQRNPQQQYPEPQYPEPQYPEQQADLVGQYDDMLPMGIY